jgi:NTP pyrophosphatase (non-canonical NTP hydrolase)
MGMSTEQMGWSALPLTIAAITAEVREVNIAKGWRAPDGGMCPGQTFGDYIALAHSELSEALEAYRDHRLNDATENTCPVVDGACFVHGRGRSTCENPKPEGVGSEFADLLIRLVDMADVFGIDLEAEYRRKVAYNRTRAFQHGGRTLADAPAPVREKPPMKILMEAIPDDPRGWWIGAEVDDFISAWERAELPPIVMGDAEGEVLWIVVQRLASVREVLGMAASDDSEVSIRADEYVVRVTELENKETKDA